MIIRPEPAKRLLEAMRKSNMILSLGLLLSGAKSNLKGVKTAYLRVVFYGNVASRAPGPLNALLDPFLHIPLIGP